MPPQITEVLYADKPETPLCRVWSTAHRTSATGNCCLTCATLHEGLNLASSLADSLFAAIQDSDRTEMKAMLSIDQAEVLFGDQFQTEMMLWRVNAGS